MYLEVLPPEERTDLQVLRLPVSSEIDAILKLPLLSSGQCAGSVTRLHLCRHGEQGNLPCEVRRWDGERFQAQGVEGGGDE